MVVAVVVVVGCLEGGPVKQHTLPVAAAVRARGHTHAHKRTRAHFPFKEITLQRRPLPRPLLCQQRFHQSFSALRLW